MSYTLPSYRPAPDPLTPTSRSAADNRAPPRVSPHCPSRHAHPVDVPRRLNEPAPPQSRMRDLSNGDNRGHTPHQGREAPPFRPPPSAESTPTEVPRNPDSKTPPRGAGGRAFQETQPRPQASSIATKRPFRGASCRHGAPLLNPRHPNPPIEAPPRPRLENSPAQGTALPPSGGIEGGEAPSRAGGRAFRKTQPRPQASPSGRGAAPQARLTRPSTDEPSEDHYVR